MQKGKFDAQKLFISINTLLIINTKWNVVKTPVEFHWLECNLHW